MPKTTTKNAQKRTQVKNLPVRRTEMTKESMRKVRGGTETLASSVQKKLSDNTATAIQKI